MSVVIYFSNASFCPAYPMIIVNKLKCLLLACLAAGVFSAVNTTAATSSNTIVRFQIRHGQTPWGNIDVELYDSQKPLTVSNFLAYVRSGAFDRSILHRAVPGFAVQGGLYSVQNPYVATPATYLNRIPEGPAIASEATNSPIIPNTFGTLAMSLSSTGTGTNTVVDRESATTSWYFNTGNNSTDLPEYTVFGKVKSGGKYLTYFNTISEDDGIINMYGLQYLLFSDCDLLTIDSETDIGLQELPVFYFEFRCPSYNDLFNVQISIIKAVGEVSDTTSPKLKIVYPVRTTETTTDSLAVTGTVTDNVAIESVRVYLGSNSPVTATVTNTAWSVTLTNMPAGTNHLLAEATDAAGNRLTAISSFFFKVPLPFTNVLTQAGTGTGTTIGVTNGQLLDVGRIYSITAIPDPTNFFVGWLNNASYIDFSATHRFYMETGKTVYAQFDTNQFPNIKGTYNGLFVSTNTVEQQSSGYFTLTVNELGRYSAKLIKNGYTIPFSDQFTTVGASSPFLGAQKGLPGTTFLKLNVNVNTPDNKLLGSVSNFNAYLVPTLMETNILVTNIVVTNVTDMITNVVPVTTNVIVQIPTTNTWSAELIADRVVFNSKLNPAPQAGKYTMIIPAETNSPAGDGYGTVTVTTAGGITFAGVLADGTKATQKTFLSLDGNWPLYVPLYKTNGSLVSWVNFSDEAMTDFSGLFNWFNQAHVAKYYAAGFTNEATIAGSRFLAPNATNQMLYLTNGTVGFTNGNLAADFANDVILDPKGKVTNQDTNTLNLSINSGNGLISGSAKPPGGGKAISFKGAVLQKQTNAAGFFLGTNASGRVYLGR